ncbi:MAG: DUF4157 domain-containing protein [Peptococcaceae bacterium]|jgi:hypothetical protein|nr:DUF4157 domain-containing protein [Peptococcaceae bacterium]
MYDLEEKKKVPVAKNAVNAFSGYELDAEIQTKAEAKFGLDFSEVRVHTDEVANLAAKLVDARAFAYGSDIYLSEDESPLDEELMSHELSHVVEQSETGEKVDKWSIPIHNLITKDAFIESKAGKLTSKDKDLLKYMQKGSAWNDMMGSMFTHGGTSGLRLAIGGGLLSGRMEDEGTMENTTHHGEMMFLHAQTDMDKTMARVKEDMMSWSQFCFDVYKGTVDPKDTLEHLRGTYAVINKLVDLPALQSLKTETNEKNTKKRRNREDPNLEAQVRVKDLFNGMDSKKIPGMAMGSMLHMIEDSFNQAHGQRTEGKRQVTSSGGRSVNIGKIKNMTDYGRQKDHAKGDLLSGNRLPGKLALGAESGPITMLTRRKSTHKHRTVGYDDAVSVCAEILKLANGGASWGDMRAFLDEVLAIDEAAERFESEEGVGTQSKQVRQEISGPEGKKSVRAISAEGRLFRHEENSIMTLTSNFTNSDAVRNLAMAYDASISGRIKKLNFDNKNVAGKYRKIISEIRMLDSLKQGVIRCNHDTTNAEQHRNYNILINAINEDMNDLQIDRASLESELASKGMGGNRPPVPSRIR